ncbi:MAG: nitroreductase/quinone reductase family protein [Anaerolineales bacterium]
MLLKRWLYKGGHPNSFAQILNTGWATLHSLGISPDYLVTLEVPGRKSGKIIRFPLVMVVVNKERYLVSMLGEEANWVRNIKAAGGKANLRHGKSEEVVLEELDVPQRAAIIKAYLQIAPGARPHIPVNKDASLSEFENIASDYPVFTVKGV